MNKESFFKITSKLYRQAGEHAYYGYLRSIGNSPKPLHWNLESKLWNGFYHDIKEQIVRVCEGHLELAILEHFGDCKIYPP